MFLDFLRDKQAPESRPPSSSSVATGVSFSKPENISVPDVVTATDVLAGAYDPSKLHPLAGIGDSLDYLLLDDDKLSSLPGGTTALPSRGWSDDLCYGTGTTYLAGMHLYMVSPILGAAGVVLFTNLFIFAGSHRHSRYGYTR